MPRPTPTRGQIDLDPGIKEFTDVLVAWALGLAWLTTVITAHRLLLTVRARDRPGAVDNEPLDREPDGGPHPVLTRPRSTIRGMIAARPAGQTR